MALYHDLQSLMNGLFINYEAFVSCKINGFILLMTQELNVMVHHDNAKK